MIQTKAPQWKEQLEASRNPSNSHSQGLLAASHGQGYPSGRLAPTHLEMVRSPQTASALGVARLQLPLSGCPWLAVVLAALSSFQGEGKRVSGCSGGACWVWLSERDWVSLRASPT